jgi:hypothetical protein
MIAQADIAKLRHRIARDGQADAYIGFDGRVMDAKVFAIIDGEVIGKEYSGCEFGVPLTAITSLVV